MTAPDSMITPSADLPLHRGILAVDIEGSTTRTNPVKGRLRRSMYHLVESALDTCGITAAHREVLIDRGDGLLVLMRPADEAPKTLVLSAAIPSLERFLADHNAGHPHDRFRLRVVVHAGEVHYDGRGWFGEALDIACRLLDDTAFKDILRQTGDPLVLAVSEDIHRTVIKHGYAGIDPLAYEPLIDLVVAGEPHRGWVRLPQRAPVAVMPVMARTSISSLRRGSGSSLDSTVPR